VTGNRLTSSDKRALVLWIIAGFIGALFASKYFFRAVPEASVNFKVSREEALIVARNFVTGMGEPLENYKSSIIFDVDQTAKVYLERELGLQKANQLMSSELNIWYWEVRFFKPLQEEEFRVRVSPSGKIIGYERKVDEARAGTSLERAVALNSAQEYLKRKIGLSSEGWDLLPEEANSTKRPNRLDWSFTWEKHGFRAKDAPYRLQVGLQGDRIGNSEEFLKIPEAWERGYQKLRNGNNTLATLFFVPYVLLLAAAVRYAMNLTTNNQTTWRGALLLGGVVAALLLGQDFNNWPHWATSYKTTDSYASFLTLRIGFAFLAAIGSAITVTLVLPAAEPLYRTSQLDQLQLFRAFSIRGLRTREFFSATVVGLCLAAVHIGYLVAFYMIAGRLGAWAPQDLNFDNSVNTALPWLPGAAVGLLASTNEEFTFRLFAIPFFARFTRSKWIAVIVPAFLWGFLHSNYPQEPAYIRGIEIGIIGVVAGLVMLRWGIIATLVWHYTVDASLVGMLLIRSNSLYFKISGVVVGLAALAPLVYAAVSYFSRGGFEDDNDLLNRARPVPEAETSPEPIASQEAQTRRYDALAPGLLGFLAVCLLVGGLIVWRVKIPSVGDYLKLSINARSARSTADQIIRQRGLDPNLFYHSVLLVDISDPATNEFLRQRIGISGLNDIYAHKVPGALWRVRYFRDIKKEEFAVILKPDGSLHSLRHTLDEDSPGGSLPKEEAVALAEKFLSEQKKLNLKQWTLVDSDSEKKPHRTDHSLTWEQIELLDPVGPLPDKPANHAHARIELQVLGSEVANYRTYIKIPDDWRRKQSEFTLVRTLMKYVFPIVFFAALGLTALAIYFAGLKTEAARAIPWRRITLWSIWAPLGFLSVFVFGNGVAAALNGYDTAIPIKMMLGVMAIGVFLFAFLCLGGIALLFGLAWYFGKLAFGENRLPTWLGMPGAYYRDAVWIGLGGSAALLGVQRLIATASLHWPTAHRAFEASFGQNFDATLPAAAIVGGVILRPLFYTGIVFAIGGFVAAKIRQLGLRALLLIAGGLALVGGDWGDSSDFAKMFVAKLIILIVVAAGVRRIIRFNLLGCFLIIASTALLSGASQLVSQPEAFYRANGYALLLGLLLLYVWPFSLWRQETVIK
jgi:membrane protease YdiL (CAAX protease family)